MWFNVIWYRTYALLKAEASRYFFGFLWWLLDPIMYASIFYFLFASGFRGGGNVSYAVHLITGIIIWRFFGSISSFSNALTSNQSLMRQIYMPKWIFPMTAFWVNSFKYTFTFVVLLIFLELNGHSITVYYSAVPLLLLIQGLLVLSLGTILAAITPFIPDLANLVPNLMMGIFFLSGIIMDISTMPPAKQDILYLNPFAVMVKAFRDTMVYERWPEWWRIGWVGILAIILCFLAFALIKRFDRIYPKVAR